MQNLPPELASKPLYLKAFIAVNVNRRDFAAALAALDSYLALEPGDLEMRLRWISLCLRQNQEGRVASFLETDLADLAGPPALRLELAQCLAHFGHAERALDLGYRVFLQNIDDPQIHLLYVGLLLKPGGSNDLDLERETIDDNVAFEIDDGRGGREWFIVEPENELRKGLEYIAPESDIARRAKGLRAGAKIVWEERCWQWTIGSIKHKYIYQLHEALDSFERHFPTAAGLERIPIDSAAEDPAKVVFEKIRERHDSIHSVFNVFDEGLIPIHMAASALGADIIEIRYGLQQAGKPYRICQGTRPERVHAYNAVHDTGASGCVVDAVTLTVILRLKLQDVIHAICGPIGVTGSTRDILWGRIKEMKEIGRPSMSLSWKNGYYYRHEPSQDEWDEAFRIREADLAWVDENATVIPAEGLNDPPEELRRLTRKIGSSFVDDMLAAQGGGRLLLCQDLAYRVVAMQTLGLKASWLQPVLMIACDRKVLSRKDYQDAVLALIEFGDVVVAIDSGILKAAAQRRESDPQCFDRVVSVLGGRQAEMLSHVEVAIDFLNSIWSSRPMALETSRETSSVLTNLLRERREWRETIAIVSRLYRQKFGINSALDDYTLAWLKGHFLVPVNERVLPLAPSF